MTISKPCVVSLSWTLRDAQNNPIDELQQPTEFFYGGHDLLERVEEALEGHEAGDEVHVQLDLRHPPHHRGPGGVDGWHERPGTALRHGACFDLVPRIVHHPSPHRKPAP